MDYAGALYRCPCGAEVAHQGRGSGEYPAVSCPSCGRTGEIRLSLPSTEDDGDIPDNARGKG